MRKLYVFNKDVKQKTLLIKSIKISPQILRTQIIQTLFSRQGECILEML